MFVIWLVVVGGFECVFRVLLDEWWIDKGSELRCWVWSLELSVAFIEPRVFKNI